MDKIVKKVIDKFTERSARGVAKYGTTLADNNTDDFLTHLQEELMDAVLYIEKLKEPILPETKMPGVVIGYDFGAGFTLCVLCTVTNEIIEILHSQRDYLHIGDVVTYELLDEFTNPELFNKYPIYTDKRFAKITPCTN